RLAAGDIRHAAPSRTGAFRAERSAGEGKAMPVFEAAREPEAFASKPGGAKARRSTTIQSVSIAARFLDILAKADGPLPLGEIARRAGTGTSTAHRYMQSLVREGLAAQDETTGRYDLGAAALNVGIAALRRIEPVEVAARLM